MSPVLVAAVLLVCCLSVRAQQQAVCKDPTIVERLLSDDAKFASPFYVIALPRNDRTERIDNVCYSYFVDETKGFFHIMSITNKDGTNEYYPYYKADITNRMGLAEANEAFISTSGCKYHDYTLTPICNVSVFILYRCFREGTCNNIDAGIIPGVDVRVTLAATPHVTEECRAEIDRSLKDTSQLQGADYIQLPNRLKPQCITKYRNLTSIGYDRAAGSKIIYESEASERFGGEEMPAQGVQPTQGRPTNTQSWAQGPPQHNPYAPVKGVQPQPPSQSAVRPGTTYAGSGAYTPAHANGHWQPGPSPWPGHPAPGDTHYHVWQNPNTKTTYNGKQANVFYHVHSWEQPPPGCCACPGR